jgi:hypothetical protein
VLCGNPRPSGRLLVASSLTVLCHSDVAFLLCGFATEMLLCQDSLGLEIESIAVPVVDHIQSRSQKDIFSATLSMNFLC